MRALRLWLLYSVLQRSILGVVGRVSDCFGRQSPSPDYLNGGSLCVCACSQDTSPIAIDSRTKALASCLRSCRRSAMLGASEVHCRRELVSRNRTVDYQESTLTLFGGAPRFLPCGAYAGLYLGFKPHVGCFSFATCRMIIGST